MAKLKVKALKLFRAVNDKGDKVIVDVGEEVVLGSETAYHYLTSSGHAEDAKAKKAKKEDA